MKKFEIKNRTLKFNGRELLDLKSKIGESELEELLEVAEEFSDSELIEFLDQHMKDGCAPYLSYEPIQIFKRGNAHYCECKCTMFLSASNEELGTQEFEISLENSYHKPTKPLKNLEGDFNELCWQDQDIILGLLTDRDEIEEVIELMEQ